jgi:ATP adenylyltransferase
VFCGVLGASKNAGDDRKTWILHRAKECFVVLNSYPYNSGHVMIIPYAHLDELAKLPAAAASEMMDLCQKVEVALRQVYRPDGINLGMNIGKAAGAGVAGHIHMHILPRWVADSNFMTVVGETRVLPETLDQTWERLKAALGG